MTRGNALVADWRHYIPKRPGVITEESWSTRNDLADRYYPQIYDLMRFSEDHLQAILTDVNRDRKPEAEMPVGARDSSRPLAWMPKRSHLEWHLFRGIAPAARRSSIPTWIRRAVIERDRGVCGICGGRVSPSDIHLDHVHPWSLGGGDTTDNLRVTHSRCNMKRGAPAAWQESG